MFDGIAEGEDVVVVDREEGVLVDLDVAELVAEAGPVDEVGAHVDRNRDQQVVGTRARRS